MAARYAEKADYKEVFFILKRYVNILVIMSLILMVALSGCGGSRNSSTGDKKAEKAETI